MSGASLTICLNITTSWSGLFRNHTYPLFNFTFQNEKYKCTICVYRGIKILRRYISTLGIKLRTLQGRMHILHHATFHDGFVIKDLTKNAK